MPTSCPRPTAACSQNAISDMVRRKSVGSRGDGVGVLERVRRQPKADPRHVRGNDLSVVTQFAQHILPSWTASRGSGRRPVEQGQRRRAPGRPNRGLAGTLGVTVGQVARVAPTARSPASTPATGGHPTGKTDVTVRLARSSARTRADLEQLPLVLTDVGANGDHVGELRTIHWARSPPSRLRSALLRSTTSTAMSWWKWGRIRSARISARSRGRSSRGLHRSPCPLACTSPTAGR